MEKLNFTKFPELDYTCTEAFNTLCTNLTFFGADKKVVMVTSFHASEGKSFISMNMMRTFARLGKKALCIDADLRRSVIASEYGFKLSKEHKGLSHYLAGMCTPGDVIYSTNIPNAFFLPVGRTVINSLGLLSSVRFPELLEKLPGLFDIIIVDAPPVDVIIDAAEIAKFCDGALVAVTYNKVKRGELQYVCRQIERSGCDVLGAVLNQVTSEGLSGKHKYYYKNYYGHDAH